MWGDPTTPRAWCTLRRCRLCSAPDGDSRDLRDLYLPLSPLHVRLLLSGSLCAGPGGPVRHMLRGEVSREDPCPILLPPWPPSPHQGAATCGSELESRISPGSSYVPAISNQEVPEHTDDPCLVPISILRKDIWPWSPRLDRWPV